MTTSWGRDLSGADRADDAALDDLDEERSIRGALRMTLLFLAVVLLLLWAGVAQAAGGGPAGPATSSVSSRP